MTYCVLMRDCMELMRKMAKEARAKHGVGDEEIIVPYLERDHGIKVVYDPFLASKNLKTESSDSYIEFVSETQYTMFILKYL